MATRVGSSDSKPVLGSSLDDLKTFPRDVQRRVGGAL